MDPNSVITNFKPLGNSVRHWKKFMKGFITINPRIYKVNTITVDKHWQKVKIHK